MAAPESAPLRRARRRALAHGRISALELVSWAAALSVPRGQRGASGMQCWVGLGVIANNLKVLAPAGQRAA